MRFIGCKALLLDNIKSVIDENAPDAKSFCDIFSGTATVARYFKQWYEVTSNDLLYFSYVLQRGTVAVDCLPTYEILQENTGISDPVAYFNGLSLEQMERLPPERRFSRIRMLLSAEECISTMKTLSELISHETSLKTGGRSVSSRMTNTIIWLPALSRGFLL